MPRGIAFRHIAVALAESDHPERAEALTQDTGSNQESTHILIATAAAYARKGEAEAAMRTAGTIEKERYRALAYAKVAVELLERSKADSDTALQKAREDAAAIKLPFAGSYAVSRTVLASLETTPKSSAHAAYDGIIDAADDIRDSSLRAYTLWALAAELRMRRQEQAASDATELAHKATLAVKSTLSQTWIYGDQVEERIDDGQRDEAWTAFADGMAIAKTITNPWGRARALGKMAGALSTLIENPTDRAEQRGKKPAKTLPQTPIPNGHAPRLSNGAR